MFETYLLYLMSFLRYYTDIRKEADPVSPFTYEEWIMCGMPVSYIPGISLEDNQYLTIIDADDNLVGYIKLDERMAGVIAEGINNCRFKIGKKDRSSLNDLSGKDSNPC